MIDDISNTSWSEYGRLVLKELERLNAGQEILRSELDKKFAELNNKMSEFKNTEKDVDELKKWKDHIVEVWSVSQMKESKDEIYKQKNQWQKVAGIVIAIQVIFGLLLFYIEKFVNI
jgi:hypothetical protein